MKLTDLYPQAHDDLVREAQQDDVAWRGTSYQERNAERDGDGDETNQAASSGGIGSPQCVKEDFVDGIDESDEFGGDGQSLRGDFDQFYRRRGTRQRLHEGASMHVFWAWLTGSLDEGPRSMSRIRLR